MAQILGDLWSRAEAREQVLGDVVGRAVAEAGVGAIAAAPAEGDEQGPARGRQALLARRRPELAAQLVPPDERAFCLGLQLDLAAAVSLAVADVERA